MTKPKSVRVWVAVVMGKPVEIAMTKDCLEAGLQNNQWPRGDYLTIRRAILTLDPLKPKRRKV